MTTEIILLFVFILLIFITVVLFWPESTRSKWKRLKKQQLNNINRIRHNIDVKISIYKEDVELNALLYKYPFLEEEIDEYRRAREDYTGIGTVQTYSEYLKIREQITEHETDED